MVCRNLHILVRFRVWFSGFKREGADRYDSPQTLLNMADRYDSLGESYLSATMVQTNTPDGGSSWGRKRAKNSGIGTSRSIYSVRAWSSSEVKYHIGIPDTYPPYPYHNYDILEHFNFFHRDPLLTTYFCGRARRRRRN